MNDHTATRWAWDVLPGSHLDAPHRLTLLAVADLYDRAAAHTAQEAAATAERAARMNRLIPGAVFTDAPTRPAAEPVYYFAPGQLVDVLGVTAPTITRYCRHLVAAGHLESVDNRTFTVPRRVRDRPVA